MLPKHLSGGEQQRLAFAQAVVGGPALVVADEPTAELDSETAGALVRSIHELAKQGSTFVVSTHDPDVVAASDQVLALRHGALEAETRLARRLSVIDEAGRIQLPPEALKLFPGRRAEITVLDGDVRITPP
jgi:putative ABC transport system ATP-binding protein